VAAAVAGLAAAWMASGSLGLAAHSFRHALTWVAMGVAVAAWWPQKPGRPAVLLVVLAVAAAIAMTASPLQPVNVLAVAVLMAGLSAGRSGTDRRVMVLVARAVAAFGVYRLAVTSIPILWTAFDAAGAAMGRIGGAVTGQPLSVGATFAGVDFLVLMAALFGLWLAATPKPRLPRAIGAGACILLVHLVYLVILSHTPRLIAAVPTAEPPNPAVLSAVRDAPWSFWAALHTLLPWNLPVLAGLGHVLVVCGMLRWAPIEADAERRRSVGFEMGLSVAAGLAALILPAATSLYGPPAGLAGKKIVVNEKGFLNWLRPTHQEYGRLAIGMYGMLGDFLESLGATLVRTEDFSAKDLDGASAVILIFPNKPWQPGQLERIRQFVEGGGSLLVMGEHTIREKDGGARFNDALAGTRMRVSFDSAQWAVGGWLNCYEALAHPVTCGRRDERNDFGVVIGASVDARWPARPLILGRWGWSDRGDVGSPRAMMGNDRLDAGERLGDVCLAAEQSIGRGKVVVFGDTSPLTNGIVIGAHGFVSALMGYVTGPSCEPSGWRGVVGALAAAGTVVILLIRGPAWRTAAVGLAAAISLTACTAVTHRANGALPDGRLRTPNNLAYIDTSHLEAFSQEALRDDGVMGLEYTLMRNGFLTLGLGDFRADALQRAAVLVSVAPARPFSPDERRAVSRFVESGGVFICTAGYDRCGPASALLADFGLRVGVPGAPAAEPKPLGHFKSPYVNVQGRMHYVRFHAAWPVAADDAAPDGRRLTPAQVIAYGAGDVPVILLRPWGRGKVVLIGDTCFAMNKNLERVDGSPFEGMRENADFWRWFLGYAAGRPPWTPPGPREPPAEVKP
jgi:hypothetical protein